MFGFVLMHTHLRCYYQCVPLIRAISGFLFATFLLWNTNQIIIIHVRFKILSSIFISGNFENVSRKGGQALSPHGEEAYKNLIYIQACNNRKPGARRNFVGCGKFSKCLV